MLWNLLLKYGPGVLIGFLVGLATGAGLVFSLTFGLIDDVILAMIAADLSIFETVALNVLVDETEHAVVQLYDYEEESQRERDAQARSLARQNPSNVYLFGDFSIYDGLALGTSAYVVGVSELPETAFKYVAGLLDLL
jgi:hypothetical protein